MSLSRRLTHRLGVQLAEITLGQGIGQGDMADRLGVSRKHMNLVWNGRVRGTDEFLSRWADLLGYEVVIGLRLKP